MIAVITLSKKFFGTHPKAGEPTDFRRKSLEREKIHTCRVNFEYWRDKIDKIKNVGGVLSLRQWSGKPYNSEQELVVDIPIEEVGVQQLKMMLSVNPDGSGKSVYVDKISRYITARVDDKPVDMAVLAKNDGLEMADYIDWFLPAFKSKSKEQPKISLRTFTVIQFTSFRY